MSPDRLDGLPGWSESGPASLTLAAGPDSLPELFRDNTPLRHIDAPPLPKGEPLIVHCGHADRSTVAISLLQQHGFEQLTLLYGGFSAWQAAGYPIERDRE